MKIAVLGWGSLIWCSGSLQIKGRWKEDGPPLPIEFARISEDGRLTLVLCSFTEDVQSLWTHSSYDDLKQAKNNLCEREGTIMDRIGYISIPDNESDCEAVPLVLDSIRQWVEEKALDAVIWTDLPSNFKERTCMKLNEENVITYLKGLTEDRLKKAEKYIRRAPRQIKTKIRDRIQKEFGWTDE